VLAITPRASEAIRAIVMANEAPEGAVVRIDSEPEEGLQIALVDGAQPDDVLIEEDGAELALDPTVAVLLDDKRLDASFEEGLGVTFSVSDQASSNGRPPALA
jgi:Fe-S cluster assembly iron-binding protein IscA